MIQHSRSGKINWGQDINYCTCMWCYHAQWAFSLLLQLHVNAFVVLHLAYLSLSHRLSTGGSERASSLRAWTTLPWPSAASWRWPAQGWRPGAVLPPLRRPPPHPLPQRQPRCVRLCPRTLIPELACCRRSRSETMSNHPPPPPKAEETYRAPMRLNHWRRQNL